MPEHPGSGRRITSCGLVWEPPLDAHPRPKHLEIHKKQFLSRVDRIVPSTGNKRLLNPNLEFKIFFLVQPIFGLQVNHQYYRSIANQEKMSTADAKFDWRMER